MRLDLKERLLLIGILNSYSGNAANIRILEDLRKNLGVTEEEYEEFGIQESENGVRWNPNVSTEKELPVGKKAERIVAERLEQLGEQNQLTLEFASLCNKFLDSEEVE